MKTYQRYLLCAVVLISSLTCQTLFGGTVVELDDAAMAEGEIQLQEMIGQETELGELYEIDKNQDGQFDEVIYHYPDQQIETDVVLESNLLYSPAAFPEQPDLEGYYKSLYLILVNQSQEEKHVRFTYEVPKDFAVYVSELVFIPEPAEIVNPDVVVLYDIVLPALPASSVDEAEAEANTIWIMGTIVEPLVTYVAAKEKARDDAFKQMMEMCKSLPYEKRGACYLSLVSDFKDKLKPKEMETICTQETNGTTRRMCFSVIKDSAGECDKISNAKEVQVCKGFYVNYKCKGLDGGELQACLKDKAIANKAPLGCKGLDDADVRNECYAKASRKSRYCARINNDARRKSCEQALGTGGGQASGPGSDPGSVDPGNWFTGDKAKTDCQFYSDSLALYTLSYSKGEYFHDIATLSCGMDSSDPYGTLYEGSVWIWAYDSAETAQQVWETDETDGYTYATLKQQQERNADPDLVIVLEPNRYFSTYKTEYSDRPPTYLLKAGSLYKNARIAILYRDMVDQPTSWLQIEALFKQMVDQKIQGR